MNRYDDEHTSDPSGLDGIVSDIRDEAIDPKIVEAAAGRVWSRLSGDGAREASERTGAAFDTRAGSGAPSAASSMEDAVSATIRGCEGFQALIPAYLARSLAPARALLLEDHVRDCAACRGAVAAAREGRLVSKVVPFGTPATARSTEPRRVPAGAFGLSRPVLAAAAAFVIGIVGLGVWLQIRPGSSTARVHSLRGTLYHVVDGVATPLAENATFHYGEEVRTAKDSGAVIRLADGSLVEMSERAEMSIGSGLGGTTIQLPRGNIIVQATKRASGHLFVKSEDALVSVTGTIFAVSRGTKGARVSVIEGEVHVDHAGEKDVLRPGQQVTTQASLTTIPVEQDIAWSKDVDRYITLLREIKSLREDLATTQLMGGLRYSSNLLDAQPDRTLFFAAIPNVSRNLAEANGKIQEHIAQSSVLRQWWESHHGAMESAEMKQVLEKIQAYGDHLGSEVTVSVQMGSEGNPSGVLLMSELTRPAEFRSFLESEVAKANRDAKAGGKNGAPLRILPEDLTAAGPDGDASSFTHQGPHELVLWVHGDKFVAASSVGLVREAAANLDHPRASAFASSSFHQRIADSYREGAGWLFCVDVEKVLSRAAESAQENGRSAALQQTGILDAKQFILEVKETGDRTNTRGVLSFGQERRGIVSWLAAPAPMGALDFISPEASMAAAFVVKEPVLLVDDLFGVLSAANPGFQEHLNEFEAESGVHIKDDVAAPLGGEFAFALDGPVLPVPSWKAVMEVYDPPRLQSTLERIIAKAAEKATEAGRPVPSIEREDAGGRTFYTVRAGGSSLEVHYTYVDGYLVAAPARALIESAIQKKESGYVLAGSQTFRDLLPQDGRVNFSAVVYQNVGPLLKPIAQGISGATGLTPQQQASVDALTDQAKPSLAYAYGEQDRIIVATSGAGSLASQLGGGLFGMEGNEAGVGRLFANALHHSAQGAASGAQVAK